MTDRNNDPDVSKILDIIDEKHSRYEVAKAVADWVKGERAEALAEGRRVNYHELASTESAFSVIQKKTIVTHDIQTQVKDDES